MRHIFIYYGVIYRLNKTHVFNIRLSFIHLKQLVLNKNLKHYKNLEHYSIRKIK